MISLQYIPIATIFWLLALAVGLFLAFRAIRYYILPTIHPRKRQEQLQAIMLRGEPIVWGIVLLWIIYRLLLAAPGTTIFLLLLISFPTYFWLRDYIPGLFFRYDHDAEPGDLIYFRNDTFTLEEIRARSLKLRDHKNTVLVIPFRMLGVIKVAKQAQASSLLPHEFFIETETTEDRIVEIMNECPWIPPGKMPLIQSEGAQKYTITTYALNQEIAEKQEAYLQARL